VEGEFALPDGSLGPADTETHLHEKLSNESARLARGVSSTCQPAGISRSHLFLARWRKISNR
jgi:hypothetical protein